MTQATESSADASHAVPHRLSCERCGLAIRPCDRLWCAARGDHPATITCIECAVETIRGVLRAPASAAREEAAPLPVVATSTTRHPAASDAPSS